MHAMKIFWCCVSLSLPLIICGQEALSNVLAKMNEISRRGEFINGVIKPSIEGYIGKGIVSFTYRGTLRESNKKVAMKVTLPNDRLDAKHEYEIYTYLGAINSSTIEAYGIPSVYYYGQWNGCYLIAITLMDSKFNERCKLRHVNEVDILIISREFVRSLKYIHSCGICHNDIHSMNMMFRGHKGFIIDFSSSHKMYEINSAQIETDCKKIDWAKYFIMLNEDFSQFTKDIRYKKGIKLNGLKRVYSAFAESQIKAGMPDYDGIYKIINEEIEKCQLAVVSWLTPQERRIAIDDARSPIPSIESMKVPSEKSQIRYRNVDYHFFEPKDSASTCSVM